MDETVKKQLNQEFKKKEKSVDPKIEQGSKEKISEKAKNGNVYIFKI